jgi:hypothetical protein
MTTATTVTPPALVAHGAVLCVVALMGGWQGGRHSRRSVERSLGGGNTGRWELRQGHPRQFCGARFQRHRLLQRKS